MGKNIFITGASSGIGKTIGEHLTLYGHTVVGTSRNPTGKDSNFQLVPLDVTDELSVHTACQAVFAILGSVDVLINCAGYGLFGAIEDASMEEAKDQFETNYFGVVRVTNAFIPHFREKGEGLIINISSLGGLIGLPFQGHYSATKFALEGYAEALRMELMPFNIVVCNINPGDFTTSFTANRQLTKSVSHEYKLKFEQFLKMYAKEEENGADPILIAKLINRLIKQNKKLQVRYVVGKKSQTMAVFIKRLVGQQLFEKVMIRMWKV